MAEWLTGDWVIGNTSIESCIQDYRRLEQRKSGNRPTQLLNRKMDYGNAVGQLAVNDIGKSNIFKYLCQFIGQGPHANRFGQVSISRAGSGN